MNRTFRATRALALGLGLAAVLSAEAQVTPAASAPAYPTSPAKKELVVRLLAQQQPAIERLARNLAEEPAQRLVQQVAAALQTRVAPEKREAVGKKIEADVRKYVEEAVPLVRDRAIKIMPATLGAAFEEKFSEDELRQMLTWLESPVNKKYQQIGSDLQNDLVKKLVADARPAIDAKLKTLEASIVKAFEDSTAGSAPGAASRPSGKAASSAVQPKQAPPPRSAGSAPVPTKP